MISYFIKSASCLALLLFFYHFILEKEKMHSFNRFYLLIGVVISLLIPFATITTNSIPETLTAVTTLTEPKFSPENMATIEVEEVIDYTKYFAGFYLLISSLLLIRFGRNLFKIIQKIRLNEKINHANATLVLVNDKILPHTFWKAIFINKNEYENGNIEEELFTHELTHVTQKHTIDVLLIEFLQILFWINPLFIFLKKAVQLNHEFLADEKVIHQHKNTFQYQHLLLNKATWNNEYYLASNLNYSLTKKRLKMMTTQSSQSKIWIKKLAVIPLLAGFIFLFAERVEAQEKQEIIEVVEELPRKGIITENEVYKNYINRNAYVTYKNKEGKKVSKLYTELTNEEKKRLVLPPPPPLKLKKFPPTKAQFEALKDNSKFAVWLDGKVVKKETLNNYKHTDFARYSNSFVYKNARSKRFPKENQAHLETTKYFEANNKKRVADFESFKKNYNKEITEIVEQKSYKNDYEIRKMIDDVSEFYDLENYNKLNKLYESKRSETPHYVNSSKERQNILNTNFSILGTVYFNLTKSEKKKTKRPISPHDPYLKLKKNNLVFYKLRNELTEEDKLLIPPPPPVPNASKEEILKAKKAYQDWKKRTGNDIPPPPPPRKKNN